MRQRLVLITPADIDPLRFPARLAEALSGGDVASLIIAPGATSPAAFQRLCELLVPVAAKHEVASLVVNDGRIAARAGADGVQVETGLADLRTAVERLHPGKIVGAGGVHSRHDAMTLGEAGPDYLFFGRLDGDIDAMVFPKTLELASWWAELFEIPAILMAGAALESVGDAARSGAEFVALRRAVWDYPDGPGAAVAAANALLTAREPA